MEKQEEYILAFYVQIKSVFEVISIINPDSLLLVIG